MKKNSSIVAATLTAIALSLTACSPTSPSGSSNASGTASGFGDCKVTGQPGTITLQTHKPGILSVSTVLPSPGWFNGTNPDSVKSGFEYCMAANIAYRAGLKSVEVKNLAWDQFISGTATGYDIGLAEATITDKRKAVFDFSRKYFSSNLGVATKKDSQVTADNIHEAKIGVLQGNMGAQWVSDVLKPAKPAATFQSQTDMFTALSSGQVDAVITDTTLALTGVKESSGALVVSGQFALDQGYGVVLPLHSDNTAQVDQAVGQMDADGTLKALATEYLQPMFGVDPTAVPVWTAK